ncbi:hypothetical protein [Aureimonas leprariae]|nr:hypothetical protein [Aureimonas leprariae]
MSCRTHSHAHLPSTLGFSPVDDRTRLPGRFFYRLIVGRKLG